MLKLTSFGSPNDDPIFIVADEIGVVFRKSDGPMPYSAILLKGSDTPFAVKEDAEDIHKMIEGDK